MEKLTTFINLQTDYGFKLIFGLPENKHILMRFLNAVFGDDLTVTDVVYHNKEILPATPDGKRIIYDIYCTSQEQKHHFILEMQNAYEPPFEDRMLYYTAKAVAGQGQAGWTYELKPVITIVVMDFDLRGMKKALVHDFRVADVATGEILSDKMRMIMLSLARIEHKTWKECESEIERLLYLIKNMDKLEKDSEIYRSKEYKEIFDAAESQSLASEDVVAYSQSLQRLRDMQSGIEFARKESFQEGMEEGRKEGRKEGMERGWEQAQLTIARNLKRIGTKLQDIMAATNLSADVIAGL